MRPVVELVSIGRGHFHLATSLGQLQVILLKGRLWAVNYLTLQQVNSWCHFARMKWLWSQLTWLADQNQPLISLGKNSGLSQPSKLHLKKHQFDVHTGEKFKIAVCELIFAVKKNFKNDSLWVGLAAGGPEELDAPVYESFHPVVLLLGLKRYKVHASFPGGVYGSLWRR